LRSIVYLRQVKSLPRIRRAVQTTPEGDGLDVEEHRGTVLDEVLDRPKDNLTIDPRVLGGYPVVSGTRVPYDVVAGLADEGYTEAEIIELYPSVKPESIADATAFAQDVAGAAKGALARDEPRRVATGTMFGPSAAPRPTIPRASGFGSAGHHVLRCGHKRGRSRQ
jgi:uncharacterized protein (DUF433 family)